MKKQDIITELSKLKDCMEVYNIQEATLYKILGMADGEFEDNLYKIFDISINAVAELYELDAEATFEWLFGNEEYESTEDFYNTAHEQFMEDNR